MKEKIKQTVNFWLGFALALFLVLVFNSDYALMAVADGMEVVNDISTISEAVSAVGQPSRLYLYFVVTAVIYRTGAALWGIQVIVEATNRLFDKIQQHVF